MIFKILTKKIPVFSLPLIESCVYKAYQNYYKYIQIIIKISIYILGLT